MIRKLTRRCRRGCWCGGCLPHHDRAAASSRSQISRGGRSGGGEAASAGRIDPDAVAALLEAAGAAVPRMGRPAGLTDREAQVISMVAKGLQTKQVGHRLGISAKSADRHLQNAYAKMGVSTRAAVALLPCSTASPPGENSRYQRS